MRLRHLPVKVVRAAAKSTKEKKVLVGICVADLSLTARSRAARVLS